MSQSNYFYFSNMTVRLLPNSALTGGLRAANAGVRLRAGGLHVDIVSICAYDTFIYGGNYEQSNELIFY